VYIILILLHTSVACYIQDDSNWVDNQRCSELVCDLETVAVEDFVGRNCVKNITFTVVFK